MGQLRERCFDLQKWSSVCNVIIKIVAKWNLIRAATSDGRPGGNWICKKLRGHWSNESSFIDDVRWNKLWRRRRCSVDSAHVFLVRPRSNPAAASPSTTTNTLDDLVFFTDLLSRSRAAPSPNKSAALAIHADANSAIAQTNPTFTKVQARQKLNDDRPQRPVKRH